MDPSHARVCLRGPGIEHWGRLWLCSLFRKCTRTAGHFPRRMARVVSSHYLCCELFVISSHSKPSFFEARRRTKTASRGDSEGGAGVETEAGGRGQIKAGGGDQQGTRNRESEKTDGPVGGVPETKRRQRREEWCCSKSSHHGHCASE